ncbi:MAG TPA: PEP-CTERM sorting domain-containing protein [Bryobacteraceae bacterium]|nr:PEP-CTERM sorting domain-containing protein [Bryobacteraceae bacterium]HPT28041.1 PEP-CTERM sorting domain-containing protein [Bryobacteraceae bacterium]
MKTFLVAALGAVVLACTVAPPLARGGTLTFDVLPAGGAISGPAGSTIGWGYSLTNESASEWLLTVGLNTDSFLDGTPILLFDFPILAPNGSVTVPFDELTSTGLFMLIWDLAAPASSVNSGTFVLSAQWWDGDPLDGGNYIMDALDAGSAYSATVSESTGTIPEPSTWLLVLTAFGTLAYRRVLSRRR